MTEPTGTARAAILDGIIARLSADKNALLSENDRLRAELAVLRTGPPTPKTEDEAAFGVDAWVYCNQHMRAHQTGWCTVSPRDKIGLGVATGEEAERKCREWKLELFADQPPVRV